MRRFLDVRAAARGAAIALACSGLSLALAVLGFGNAYYLSVFLPFFMLSCLALAWFAFLRSDGLGRRPGASADPEPRPAEPVAVPGLGASSGGEAPLGVPAGVPEGSERGSLDRSLYARLDSGLIERRPLPAGRARPKASGAASLLWAALWLAAAATALYRIAGVGARYFI